MQIIQSIRDKGAAVVIVVIALSLIGFILMDAKQGSSKLFGNSSTQVGKINGEVIELADFNKKVKEAEDMQTQRNNGQRPTGTQIYQIRDQTWNQVIAEKVFFAEAEKAGIVFTPNELSYILLSNDPSNPFLQEQSLKDSITGKLDVSKAQAALTNIKKFKGEQRESVNAQVINPLRLSTTVAKYSGLLNASAYYPTWMQEKDAAENMNFANISYVNIPYSEVADSLVKVTGNDVSEYINKNKELFKQEEEARNISYVAFSQLPSGEDSSKARSLVSDLKTAFELDSNAKSFIARNISSIDFTDEYLSKSKMGSTMADTLATLPVGGVFGPYVDKGSFILAKMLGVKQMPDSAKARHILISINDKDPNGDATAKKIADSLYNAILAGADFTMLAMTNSTDQGSKVKGGDLGTFAYGAMAKEFNEFCFTKTPGSKAVVKTQFGYHIIDLLSQKDFKPAYKIAFLGKEILPSDATINKASLDATKASAEKSKEKLEKYITKNNLSLTAVPAPIKRNDYNAGALQDARSLVRWTFEAKKGDVSDPFSIGDQFIVAVLDKIMAKGLQDTATARSGCENTIRNKKKAEIIIKKIGNTPTLESAATAYNKQAQVAGADSSLTFGSQIINGVGMEAKVIGASFNKGYQTKVSPPIEGSGGVFVIKINSIQPKAAATPEEIATQISTKTNAIRSQQNNWYEGLRKQAEIKDERSNHF